MNHTGELSESKRRLLSNLLTAPSGRSRPAILRRPAEEPIPLSFAQQQVWIHSQMAGEVPIYNETITIYRNGPVDLSVLERCFVEVIRRHEVWRTTFDLLDGKPVQVVQPVPQRFPIELTDLVDFPPADREIEARRLATKDARKPFDLKAGPLLRAILVRMAEADFRVYMTFHQIVFDATSAYRVLMPELSALYEAFSVGTSSPLAEPTLQYGDFAYWQQKNQTDSLWSKQLEFWRGELRGELPVLSWPNDHPRPAYETHRGAIERFKFDPALIAPLREFCQREGVSAYMTVVASYAALLTRYTGLEEIILGGLSGSRQRPELESLVGYFVNPLALRIDLRGNPTFQELAKRTMRVVLDALANDEVPFHNVVESLQLRPDPGRNPIFQIIVSQQPRLLATISGWGLATEEISNGGSKMDMIMVLDERPDGISGPITYNPDLFDTSTIARMIAHWQVLLRQALANPKSRISELPLLTDAERTQILAKWNDTHTDYPQNVCLHDLVEAQVERTPHAVAVEFDGNRLSYGELNERANQVAHRLRKVGVGPEGLVGVFMERSSEMVIALLGILKAGGAYIPIDPEFPVERVAFMLGDANAPVILTQSRLVGALPHYSGKVICMDDRSGPMTEEPSTNLGPIADPDNLAYVIYTSGSTGTPKGALNTHRAICNRLLWMQDRYCLTDSDAVLQKTPFSFDVSLWEFFWPLLAGARLVVARPGGHRDPEYLVRQITECQVTVLHFVPSMLGLFLAHSGAGQCRSLRHVICSGEALPFSMQEQFFKRLDAQLHNLYGPTEAAVDVTHWTCQRDGQMQSVPIGRPVANTSIYILDRFLEPVPLGVPGELYIGGVQVGRGYLNRPQLTAERFIPDPFNHNHAARLYKTGDLCRWLSDGNVEYLGRLDFQVKIRGFRIELGEIEAVLDRHAAVRQSVVAACEGNSDGEKMLVAYFESTPGTVPDIDSLRAHLKQELPEYMVPSAFVALDKLPLSPNGKIDRKALPKPQEKRIEVQENFIAPRDEVERILANLWSKILKVRRVGLHDNFFSLGGHSLAAIRIIVEIERLYNRRLPLTTLLEAPTIAQLAEVLRKQNWRPSWQSLVPVRPGGSRQPLFLLHSHSGEVLEYFPLANRMDSDQPVYGLQARGLDGHMTKNQSLEEMAANYVTELRSFQPEGPYLLGGFCLGGLIAYETAQQLSAAGEEVALLVMIQTMNPAFARFKPSISLWRRWWHLATHRLTLERENLGYRGTRYIQERGRRTWDVIRARAEITIDNIAGKHKHRREHPSLPYILESMMIEQNKARIKYKPRPYSGNVLLLRARKQITGLMIDDYLGWNGLLRGNLEVCEVPGHQQNMLAEPHVSQLASTIRDRLLPVQERCEANL